MYTAVYMLHDCPMSTEVPSETLDVDLRSLVLKIGQGVPEKYWTLVWHLLDNHAISSSLNNTSIALAT